MTKICLRAKMTEIDIVTLSNLVNKPSFSEEAIKDMIVEMEIRHLYRDHNLGVRQISKILNIKMAYVIKTVKDLKR